MAGWQSGRAIVGISFTASLEEQYRKMKMWEEEEEGRRELEDEEASVDPPTQLWLPPTEGPEGPFSPGVVVSAWMPHTAASERRYRDIGETAAKCKWEAVLANEARIMEFNAAASFPRKREQGGELERDLLYCSLETVARKRH